MSRNHNDNYDEWRKCFLKIYAKWISIDSKLSSQLNMVLKRESALCIPIPRESENELTVNNCKTYPHVVLCRLSRFMDLDSRDDLTEIGSCVFPYKNHKNLSICINPYHYTLVRSTTNPQTSYSNRQHELLWRDFQKQIITSVPINCYEQKHSQKRRFDQHKPMQQEIDWENEYVRAVERPYFPQVSSQQTVQPVTPRQLKRIPTDNLSIKSMNEDKIYTPSTIDNDFKNACFKHFKRLREQQEILDQEKIMSMRQFLHKRRKISRRFAQHQEQANRERNILRSSLPPPLPTIQQQQEQPGSPEEQLKHLDSIIDQNYLKLHEYNKEIYY